MNDALYIAATGMQMQQKSVDTISNNIANINTPGFKKGHVSFEDLVYRELGGAVPGAGAAPGGRLLQGSGVALAAIVKSFAAAELKQTSAPMDIAVKGDGFIEVSDADGSVAYTRGGTFSVDKDGFLVSPGGYALKNPIRIGSDVKDMSVESDGRVLVRTGSQDALVEIGKIELVRFADASGLEALGNNLYRPSERSGDAIAGLPGEGGLGTLAQGFVESSNVNLVEEMVDLMIAQRAYESSVKVIQASDEMLAMSNNLRK
jgi:flagellar basal-body rod protein FlgG